MTANNLTDYLLETRGLSRHFGGIKAVDKVDFQLLPGQIHALIGPNGAGKSTFVSLLCGRIEPTAGQVFFQGRDITGTQAHERTVMGLAYTFQITSVFDNLTCYQNVELAVQRRLSLDNKKLTAKHLKSETEAALERTNLLKLADERAREISYGHQRMLEVSMGLALNPVLLLLDEPTQGMADWEIGNFITLIRNIVDTTTVLLIEHNMNVVMELAHRITVLNDGTVLASGSPGDIRGNVAVQQAYLGTGDTQQQAGDLSQETTG